LSRKNVLPRLRRFFVGLGLGPLLGLFINKLSDDKIFNECLDRELRSLGKVEDQDFLIL